MLLFFALRLLIIIIPVRVFALLRYPCLRFRTTCDGLYVSRFAPRTCAIDRPVNDVGCAIVVDSTEDAGKLGRVGVSAGRVGVVVRRERDLKDISCCEVQKILDRAPPLC